MSTEKSAGIAIPEDIAKKIDNALLDGKPMIVSYVDEAGRPQLSFRGSTHVHAGDALGIWARHATGGFISCIQKNPHVTLLYRDPQERTTLIFAGRAHVEDSDPVRSDVYDRSPKPERDADAERKGVAVVVELDSVRGGTVGGAQVNQTRS